jgi:hypothetical protein
MRNRRRNMRKLIALGAVTAALGVGGVSIAEAVGGESDNQITGPRAEQAKQAAGKLVEGGYPVGVEAVDEKGAVWDVKVAKPGLSVGTSLNEKEVPRYVHVLLDRDFEWVAWGDD